MATLPLAKAACFIYSGGGHLCILAIVALAEITYMACFGGAKAQQAGQAASKSLYSLYVNAQGADKAVNFTPRWLLALPLARLETARASPGAAKQRPNRVEPLADTTPALWRRLAELR